MIIRKTRSAKWNLGNYEHMESFVTVELTHDEVAAFDNDEKAQDYVDEFLEDWLAPDADQASRITAVEDSAVFPYIESTTNSKRSN